MPGGERGGPGSSAATFWAPPACLSPCLWTLVLFRFPVSVESARFHSVSRPNGSFSPPLFQPLPAAMHNRTAPRQQSMGKWGWKAAPLACLQGSKMAHTPELQEPRMPGGTNTRTHTRAVNPHGLLTGASIELMRRVVERRGGIGVEIGARPHPLSGLGLSPQLQLLVLETFRGHGVWSAGRDFEAVASRSVCLCSGQLRSCCLLFLWKRANQ